MPDVDLREALSNCFDAYLANTGASKSGDGVRWTLCRTFPDIDELLTPCREQIERYCSARDVRLEDFYYLADPLEEVGIIDRVLELGWVGSAISFGRLRNPRTQQSYLLLTHGGDIDLEGGLLIGSYRSADGVEGDALAGLLEHVVVEDDFAETTYSGPPSEVSVGDTTITDPQVEMIVRIMADYRDVPFDADELFIQREAD